MRLEQFYLYEVNQQMEFFLKEVKLCVFFLGVCSKECVLQPKLCEEDILSYCIKSKLFTVYTIIYRPIYVSNFYLLRSSKCETL